MKQTNNKTTQQHYPCPYCERTYKSQQTLHNHKKNIHYKETKKQFDCPNCQKTYHQPRLAEMCCELHKCKEKGCNHERALEGYKTQSALKNHIDTFHRGIETSCPCPFRGCNRVGAKSPTNLGNLRTHFRIHDKTGKTMYRCAYCKKRFASLQQISQHSESHKKWK